MLCSMLADSVSNNSTADIKRKERQSVREKIFMQKHSCSFIVTSHLYSAIEFEAIFHNAVTLPEALQNSSPTSLYFFSPG